MFFWIGSSFLTTNFNFRMQFYAAIQLWCIKIFRFNEVQIIFSYFLHFVYLFLPSLYQFGLDHVSLVLYRNHYQIFSFARCLKLIWNQNISSLIWFLFIIYLLLICYQCSYHLCPFFGNFFSKFSLRFNYALLIFSLFFKKRFWRRNILIIRVNVTL